MRFMTRHEEPEHRSIESAARSARPKLPYTVQQTRTKTGEKTKVIVASFATRSEAMKHLIQIESRAAANERFEMVEIRETTMIEYR